MGSQTVFGPSRKIPNSDQDYTEMISIMILVPSVFVQLTTNALNKLQFMTSIKLLHVSAPGYHPRGVF